MRLLSTIFIMFLVSNLIAQSNFTKAIIYKADNSRLDCFIKNTTYEGTQQVFEYTMEKGGALKTVRSEEISKVEFEDGMILERYFIKFTTMNLPFISRRKANYLAPENNFSGWYMLEKILAGSLNLYLYIDKYEFSHFYYKYTSDSLVQKLEHQVYTTDEGDTIVNNTAFRNDLYFQAVSAGCNEKLLGEINRVEYKQASLIPVFKKINQCMGSTATASNASYANKSTLRVGVVGGISATNLTMARLNPGLYPGFDPKLFSSQVSPILGVSVEIVPGKRQKNYIVSVDALYHNYKAETDSIHPNIYTTTIGYIKFSSLNISPMVRFRLTNKEVTPFIEGGLSIRLILDKEDYYLIRTNVDVKKPIFGNKGSSQAFVGGVGVDLKRFTIHVRYSLAARKSSTYYNTIFVMGKFIFSKKKA